jgi:cell wall-associated NlpC family hydrolase
MKREDIVSEAHEWIGTPFHANQMVKGLGADCIGTVAGISIANGAILPDMPRSYPMRPNGTLKPYLDKHFDLVSGDPQPADILLMAFGDSEPHHIALYIGNDEIIHAYAQARRVAKQKYTKYWKDKTVAAYRFKGIE